MNFSNIQYTSDVRFLAVSNATANIEEKPEKRKNHSIFEKLKAQNLVVSLFYSVLQVFDFTSLMAREVKYLRTIYTYLGKKNTI